MSELQDNVLDDQNSDYTDLESLLEVANSAEFSVSDGFTPVSYTHLTLPTT